MKVRVFGTRKWPTAFAHVTLLAAKPPLGSLSNDDSDDYEDGKKAIGLDWQNNNFASA